MTKAELVENIASATGVSKKDTGLIVNLIMDNIGQALVKGDKVEVSTPSGKTIEYSVVKITR